jgi:hypothetical protein
MYFLDMWNMQPEPGELATVAGKSIEQQAEVLVEMTRRAKRKLQDGRAELPSTLPGLFAFNLWNANKPGTSLFLPISNMTFEYMNLLFIYFSEGYRFTLVDERNGYQPAGLQKWIDKGRLDPTRRMGLVDIEQRVLSMQVVEQAFMCQNMNIAMQTMGLGGWTYTGFISSYVLGAMDVPGLGFRHIQPKEGPLVPVGRDGAFEALCPPYHASMSDAVDAFLLAAARPEAVGEIFNLGGPPRVTLARLAELLVELNEGGSFVVRAFPADRRKIDIGDYYADDRRIRRRLGWRPRVDLRTALARTLDYYRKELRHYV